MYRRGKNGLRLTVSALKEDADILLDVAFILGKNHREIEANRKLLTEVDVLVGTIDESITELTELLEAYGYPLL